MDEDGPNAMWSVARQRELYDELVEWFNDAANRLASAICDPQTYAELMDANIRALEVFQLTVARMPMQRALRRDRLLWGLFSEVWRHDVTAALVGLGCDAVLWTRFLARPTPEALADAIAVCWVGYYTAERLTELEVAKLREAETQEPAASEEGRPETGGTYRPAQWFRKGTAARLRMAARKDRKTKRVGSRKIDGVVCYLVKDVARWWPDAIPAPRNGA